MARAESRCSNKGLTAHSPGIIQVMTTANDVYDNPLIGRYASKEMAERYDRGARSLAELQEAPFPNLAMAMPEIRAALEARWATRLATSADLPSAADLPETYDPAEFTGCEGGDLNPYASYGASTSS